MRINGSLEIENALTNNNVRVDVRSFGAVGDNTADDTTAITNAINSLGATGGIVFFPKGTYKTTSQINVVNKDDISFEGSGLTSLLNSSNGTGYIFQFTDCNNIRFKNLALTGDGIASVNTIGGLNFICSSNPFSENVALDNVHFSAFKGKGCKIEFPKACTVSNSIFENINDAALHLISGTATKVYSCKVNTCNDAGFLAESMKYSSFDDCEADTCDIGFNCITSSTVSVYNCGAIDSTTYGFVSDDSTLLVAASYADGSGTANTFKTNGGTLDLLDFFDNDLSLTINDLTNLTFDTIVFPDAGVSFTPFAASYAIGRNNDGTNSLQQNIPSGAAFKFSINNVVKATLDTTALTLAAGNLVLSSGSLAVTKSLTTSQLAILTHTATQRNATDLSDMALDVQSTLTASSASAHLVLRGQRINSVNNLTGGGAVTTHRGLEIVTNLGNASSVSSNVYGIFLDGLNGAGGTITNGYGYFINALAGTNKYGVADNVGTTWYNNGSNAKLFLGANAASAASTTRAYFKDSASAAVSYLLGIHNSSNNGSASKGVGIEMIGTDTVNTDKIIGQMILSCAPDSSGNWINSDILFVNRLSDATRSTFRLPAEGGIFIQGQTSHPSFSLVRDNQIWNRSDQTLLWIKGAGPTFFSPGVVPSPLGMLDTNTYHYFTDDFCGPAINANFWLTHVVTTGTVTLDSFNSVNLTTGTTTSASAKLDQHNGSTGRLFTSTTAFPSVFDAMGVAYTGAVTSVLSRIGWATDGTSNGNNTAYFEFDSATSANWRCISKNAGTAQTTTTSVAVGLSTFFFLRIVMTSGQVEFWINNTVVATHTTQVPASASWHPSFYIQTTNGTSKTLAVDAWTGVGRR